MAKRVGGQQQRSNPRLLLWVSVAAVAVVAVLIWVSTQGATVKSGVAKSDAELGAVRNVLGPASAAATVVEYGDFQ